MGLSQFYQKSSKMSVGEMKVWLGDPGVGLTALAAGIVASACCLLPLTLIALGAGTLGWGMMGRLSQYQWLTIPVGIVLIGLAFYLYRRERHRCRSAGCQVPANSLKVLMLILAVLIVAVAAVGAVFPSAMLAVLRAIS